ncbi:copper resistance protein NlpE N-terminal domain-containing protein [Lunatimonas salinarum]|uniref:copper resistance protein NlpE N-terminal domain-containing protein n=1 Tax=Lunatimonas salinarum TaxID=1774590 RepID=UPI001ADFE7B0|nr:copper resistance protein NlpE N-terminal domain-containing protein [Lunatimonas salinarum]
MNAIRYALLPIIILLSCDSPTEETVYEEDNSPNTEEQVILHKETSYWLGYEGIIPCADCQGIRMELKLENSPDKTEQSYELTETYLETKEGDRVFH